MNLMHSCKQVAELLTLQQDRPLNWFDAARLKVHLSMCGNCENVAQQLVQLQQLSKEMFTADEVATDTHAVRQSRPR